MSEAETPAPPPPPGTLVVRTVPARADWGAERDVDVEALYPLGRALADNARRDELAARWVEELRRQAFGGDARLLGVDLAAATHYGVCFPIVEQLRAAAIAEELLARAQPQRLVLDHASTPLGRALVARAAARGLPVVPVAQPGPPPLPAPPAATRGSGKKLRRRLLLWRLTRRRGLTVAGRGSRVLDPLEATGGVSALRWRVADLDAWFGELRRPRGELARALQERAALLARLGPSPRALGEVDLHAFGEHYLRGAPPPPGATLNLAPFGFASWPGLSSLSARLVALHHLLRTGRPSAVLVEHDSEGDEWLAVQAARALGLPSACYQHGLPYSYPVLNADRLFLWGPRSGQLWERADPSLAPRLALTGDPAGDRGLSAPRDAAAARAALGLPGDARVVCLIGSLFVGLECFDAPWRRWERLAACVEAVAARPGLHLLLRPHPGDELHPWRAAAARLAGRATLAVDGRLHDLLAASDVVVQSASSVCLDAALLGRPLIQYERAEVPPLFDFAACGVPVVGSPARLGAALDRLFTPQGAAEARAALARLLSEQYLVGQDTARLGVSAIEALVRAARPARAAR